MRRTDRYSSFAHLMSRERENIDFRILVVDRDSPVAILAPHGGGIERGTSRIARRLAGRDFALYRFVGLKPQRSWELHITSVSYDEPACCRFIARYETVVTVHGCRGDGQAVYVGGLDDGLKAQVIAALLRMGFRAENVLSRNDIAGRDPRNLCNRGRTGQGVQLELDRALRRAMFQGVLGKDRSQPTETLFRFVAAVRGVLEQRARENGSGLRPAADGGAGGDAPDGCAYG